MAILRPGGTNAPLIFGVPQTSCYSIPYRLRFPYIGAQSQAGGSGGPIAYGSFVANTNTSGSAWQYQDLQGNAPIGPAIFSGTCSTANGNTSMSLSNIGIFNQFNGALNIAQLNLNLTTTPEIGPSGIFLIDQSDAMAGRGAASIGVSEPSSALSATAVASASYLGFMYQAPTIGLVPGAGVTAPQAVPQLTSPVSFGQTASSGSTMYGGTLPDDDVSTTPASNISITLGTQDSSINGWYPNASVTMPDPAQNCASDIGQGNNFPVTVGLDAQVFPTCTFPAVAMVGTPDGSYAIFLSTYN